MPRRFHYPIVPQLEPGICEHLPYRREPPGRRHASLPAEKRNAPVSELHEVLRKAPHARSVIEHHRVDMRRRA